MRENHRKAGIVRSPGELAVGSYVSSIGDGLDLRLDVLEQHRFTSELRLTYAMVDAATGAPDPSAFVRLWYRDARQVEATHCHVGRRWQDARSACIRRPTPRIRHRLRMNTFLGKWLDYLGEQGLWRRACGCWLTCRAGKPLDAPERASLKFRAFQPGP